MGCWGLQPDDAGTEREVWFGEGQETDADSLAEYKLLYCETLVRHIHFFILLSNYLSGINQNEMP